MMLQKHEEYPVATLEEYGYKDYRWLNKILSIFFKIVSVLTIVMLYLSIILIAIQSVNSSSNLASFKSFTFEHYAGIFQNEDLMNVIGNTFLVSIVATVIATILGTFIAIGIHSLSKKFRQILILINNIPLLNADIVTGISLMLVFLGFKLIFPYIFGFPTLLLSHLFFTLPYVILSVLPKLKEVDPNLMDAAADLGIKPFASLVKVVVPAIQAGIFSGMLLAFTMSIDDFVISYFNSGNGFDNLSVWIYSSIGRRSLDPAVYAFSTLLTLLTLVALLLVNTLQKKGKVK
ncbi:MAG: ABC transporter permease [Bacilli bacterium]|nr:ABC transporter permease [Bacilli bacterium]